MSRSNLDDMAVVDVQTIGDYTYYGFVSSGTNSRCAIMRENSARTEYRYHYARGKNFDAKWADKENLKYIRPNILEGRD